MSEPQENDPSLSSINHEMKTPLTGIQMMLHLLQEQKVGTLNEKQLFMVNQAKSDCDRLVRTIEQYFKKTN